MAGEGGCSLSLLFGNIRSARGPGLDLLEAEMRGWGVQCEDTKPREILLTFGSFVMLFPLVILESYKRAQTLTIPETFVAVDMESRENR